MSLEVEREATVQLLCRQFAHDQLTTQELERRIDAAYQAASLEELQALTAGLPAIVNASSAPIKTGETALQFPDATQKIRAVFASVKKKGEWNAAEVTRVRAVFAEVVLDFREARISPALTTVHVDALFSSVKIIVPPGLHVECDGDAVFGEFTHKAAYSAAPGSNAPTLRVTGRVVFGDVKVSTRLPDD